MNISNKNIVLAVVVAIIVGVIGYVEIQQRAHATVRGADLTVAVPPLDSSETGAATTSETVPSGVAKAPALAQSDLTRKALKAKKYPPAHEITPGGGFINSDPFKLRDIIGKKVILIDFWTYSCINCQRTTPYLNAWYQKYKDSGLEIVGVHSPEFDFEKVYDNVAKAVKSEEIKYPVVQDNDMATWNSYGNQYWPRKYLIDIDGYIVHDKIGEGGYDATERAIQTALKERARILGIPDTVPTGIVSPSDVITLDSSHAISPETYVGSARNQYLGNGTSGAAGPQTLTLPTSPKANTLYLGGTWNFTSEYAENTQPHAVIQYKYNAKNVYLVMTAEKAVRIIVKRDGQVVGNERGADVAKDGTVSIQTNRLYKLIQESDYGEHTLQIEVQDVGLKAYAFTFG